MKFKKKISTENINCRMDQKQERICELENRNLLGELKKRKNRNFEIIQSEENNNKKNEKE